MSIKPKYWAKIVSGEKRMEFRKVVPMCLIDGGTVVFYASAPTKRVVGEVEIIDFRRYIGQDGFSLRAVSGLTSEEFRDYCGGSLKSVWGLPIRKVTVYDEPKTLQEAYPYIKRPPQNYCYLREEEI